MKVYIATDHAGYEMKEELVGYVRDELGYTIEDCGAFEYNGEDDYPEFIQVAAARVAEDGDSRGIILGGSGQGEAMVANRTKGIRTTVFYGGPQEIITLSREHNDANMLSLGARFLDIDEAKEVVKLWLETEFSNDTRHVRRIALIDTL